MSYELLNYFPASTKILSFDTPFTLIDVGARRGFHPIFNSFPNIIKIGFEPDQHECSILNATRRDDSEQYFPVALGSEVAELPFYNMRNVGSSGILRPNEKYWSRFEGCNFDNPIPIWIIDSH